MVAYDAATIYGHHHQKLKRRIPFIKSPENQLRFIQKQMMAVNSIIRMNLLGDSSRQYMWQQKACSYYVVGIKT